MLSQNEINKLYEVASNKAEGLVSYGFYRGRESFKQCLYARMRYEFINKYGNLGYRTGRIKDRDLRYYEHAPLARVFKKSSLFSFNVHLDEETGMLNKILDKTTDEYFTSEDKSIFDIESMIKNMDDYAGDIKAINKQGNILVRQLSKVPHFIETGRWDEAD